MQREKDTSVVEEDREVVKEDSEVVIVVAEDSEDVEEDIKEDRINDDAAEVVRLIVTVIWRISTHWKHEK